LSAALVVAATPDTVDYFEEMVTSPQPPLVKRYPEARRLPLPRVRSELPQKFTEVLLGRRTVRDFKDRPVTVEQLSRICDLSFAPQQFVDAEPFGALPLRTYANAGARSELEVYINAINVHGVDPALYHYNGIEHSLELIGDAISRDDMGHLSCGQSMCAAAAVSFFITARVDRVGHKYRNPRALRAIYADMGHLAQTFAMVVTACGLGAWQTLAFKDTEIEQRLGVDGISETVLYMLGAGVPAADDTHSAHDAITLAGAERTNLYEDAAHV
jgi:SagB-type dehydrogenase family enzyme